jgi:hypothetical protein
MPHKDPKKRAEYHASYRAKHLEKARLYARAYHLKNRTKILEKARQWRLDNPEKYAVQKEKAKQKPQRPNWQKRITTEEYKSLMEKQKGCCDLCKQPFTKENPPVLDHNHITDINRGLLHPQCNCAIGLLKDSPLLCTLAAIYLRRWQQN